MSTQHQPGQQRWCALCGVHVVNSPADYSCPVCPPEKPCPTKPLWNPTSLGGPVRWGQATA